jgi:cytochrome c peroxidase
MSIDRLRAPHEATGHRFARPTAGAKLLALIVTLAAGPACAVEEPTVPIGPLSGVLKPFPNAASRAFVRPGGEQALLQLGKALFFDQQVGSDGVACATCHFHAGADVRVRNALNPGLPGGDTAFGPTNGGQGPAANLTLTAADFPLHELADPTERESAVLFDTNDTVSSAGTRYGEFVSGGVRTSSLRDRCKSGEEVIFRFHDFDVRRVEPRNTPTTINAVFFHRLFWDGRANNSFNGAGVFGKRDPGAAVLKNGALGVATERVAIRNGALASQADGPPLSDFEMSCAHKSFADLGRRLLGKKALRFQEVHRADSALATLRNSAGKGLKDTYLKMIKRAFKDEYWNATGRFTVDGSGNAVPAAIGGYTQPETNFPLFFGLAVAMYESTLVSGDTAFDRGELSELEQTGKTVFETKGKCIACHDGPELSKAASHLFREDEEKGLVERMIMGDGGIGFYDNGFYNIGVTPTANDKGLGGTDPWGNPLSFTRQYLSGNRVDSFTVDESTFAVPCPDSPCDLTNARANVDGAFKTPTLRNVALTPPYFHNGGESTLEGVIDFYNRGGNRRSVNGGDTSGTGPLGDGDTTGGMGSNLDPDITTLGLSEDEQAALLAFLRSLTDQRVACMQAPFDGPELILVNGHKATDTNRNGEADPNLVRIPPTGAAGRQADGRACIANSGELFDTGMQILLTDPSAQGPLAAPDATLQALINLLISGPRR